MKHTIQSSIRFEEEILGDLLHTRRELLLENWGEFLQSLYARYKRSDETQGDCLSRIRKRWKRDPDTFKKEFEYYFKEPW